MTVAEIADRIAYLMHPQPHMSGRQINRFHGEQRRRIEDVASEIAAEIERLREGLKAIAGFGDVDLSGEWPGQLRDIIRSMTDCAKRTLRESK
jgi:hypothetical protein